MKIIVFLFLCFCSLKSIAQYSIPKEIINKAILIELPNMNSSGTGFCYYKASGEIFIVTAKHVLFDMKTNALLDSQMLLTYYPDDITTSVQSRMKIDLRYLYQNGDVKYSNKSDIAMVKVTKSNSLVPNTGVSVLKDGVLSTFAISHMNKYDSAGLGDDIYIIGYPKSLGLSSEYQYDFNRPLLRKGTLAGKSSKNSTLIIDCPAYSGNSGGPVIEIENFNIKLVGIVVSFIPLVEKELNLNYNILNHHFVNSGYSVVESVDKIIDLANSF